MRFLRSLGACGVAVAALGFDAGHVRLAVASSSPRYGSLSGEACTGELERRHVAYRKLGPTAGVAIPVRLEGRLSGVSFRTLLPEKERATSPYEILDCRLVLAMDDLSKRLAARDVVDVLYFSAYRPPPPGWKGGVRHEGGLAIDIGYFRRADGTGLDIERSFLAQSPATKPCAPGPPAKMATPDSIALRKIACDAIDSGAFEVVLTPDYDVEHHNHFHLQVSP